MKISARIRGEWFQIPCYEGSRAGKYLILDVVDFHV